MPKHNFCSHYVSTYNSNWIKTHNTYKLSHMPFPLWKRNQIHPNPFVLRSLRHLLKKITPTLQNTLAFKNFCTHRIIKGYSLPFQFWYCCICSPGRRITRAPKNTSQLLDVHSAIYKTLELSQNNYK